MRRTTPVEIPTSSVLSAEPRRPLGKYDVPGKAHQINSVELSDGAKISVWVHPGRGTPLLFLYGLGCSNNHWKYQVDYLQKRGALTIQMDLRGHGQSTLGNPPRPLTIRNLARDVAEVLTQIGVTEIVALGQSMGGSIGLTLAHDYPEIVRALILQGSPGRDPFGKMKLGLPMDKLVKVMTSLNRKAPTWTRLLNKTAGFAPFLVKELVRVKGFNSHLAKTDDLDIYVRDFFATDPNLFYELAEDLTRFDISKFENIIQCPALVISGEKDKVVPIDEGKWLAKRLPGAELHVVPHGSHCPHLEDPTSINERIDQFLRTHQP